MGENTSNTCDLDDLKQYEAKTAAFDRVIAVLAEGGLVSEKTVVAYHSFSGILAISPEHFRAMTAHLSEDELKHLSALNELAPKFPLAFF